MKLNIILLGYLLCFGLIACDPTTESIVETSTAVPPTNTPYPTPELLREEFMITTYQMTMEDGTDLQYGVVFPNNYQEGEIYPVLLALPPGPQTPSMVRFGIDGYWGYEAQKRGWIVVSPVAPNGNLFFRESGQYIPEFLTRIEEIYPPQGDKFYIGGISNGGISAFHIAIDQPERFQKLLTLPGFPQASYFDQLDNLTNIPTYMFVGEGDTDWVERMQATEAELTRLNGNVYLEVVPNEGHVIQSLTGEQLFDILESD